MKLAVIILLFISFGLIVSCQKTQEETPKEALEAPKQLSIPKIESRFPVISPLAQEKITSWLYFTEFNNDLKNINQGNVRNYRAETERMVALSDSLLKNIPNSLNTPIILSRMRVVNVRVKLLNETMHQSTVKTNVIYENLKETNTAFSNLILQINERFEKLKIDQITRIEETKESFKKVDSIY